MDTDIILKTANSPLRLINAIFVKKKLLNRDYSDNVDEGETSKTTHQSTRVHAIQADREWQIQSALHRLSRRQQLLYHLIVRDLGNVGTSVIETFQNFDLKGDSMVLKSQK
jgi:hypothetical protein